MNSTSVNHSPNLVTSSEMVVMLHGIAMNRWSLWLLERRLQGYEFATSNVTYPSIWKTISFHAEQLQQRIQSFEQDEAISKIHFVTHSMGSIVVRCMLSDWQPQKLGRIVMLGPPNHGSKVARWLSSSVGKISRTLAELSDDANSFVNQLAEPNGIELGIIGAKGDRVVAMNSTHLETEKDHVIVPGGHSQMLFRRDVAEYTKRFLKFGSFAESSAANDGNG